MKKQQAISSSYIYTHIYIRAVANRSDELKNFSTGLPANDYRKFHVLFPVFTAEKLKTPSKILIVFLTKPESGKFSFVRNIILWVVKWCVI